MVPDERRWYVVNWTNIDGLVGVSVLKNLLKEIASGQNHIQTKLLLIEFDDTAAIRAL
jgi:hypothetical protein